jgi:hypothetical protein
MYHASVETAVQVFMRSLSLLLVLPTAVLVAVCWSAFGLFWREQWICEKIWGMVSQYLYASKYMTINSRRARCLTLKTQFLVYSTKDKLGEEALVKIIRVEFSPVAVHNCT